MHIEKRSLRFGIIFVFLLLGLAYFSFKLLLIQFFRSDYLSTLADKQQNHYLTLEPVRGTIYDRQLHPLAINSTVYSVYANPRRMSPMEKEKASVRV